MWDNMSGGCGQGQLQRPSESHRKIHWARVTTHCAGWDLPIAVSGRWLCPPFSSSCQALTHLHLYFHMGSWERAGRVPCCSRPKTTPPSRAQSSRVEHSGTSPPSCGREAEVATAPTPVHATQCPHCLGISGACLTASQAPGLPVLPPSACSTWS